MRRQVQVWIRAGCIVVAILMAATLFFDAYEIGKVNFVPYVFHRLEHFVYYGGMAFLIACGLGRRWFWIVLLAVPLIGALDEWHQFYTPGRSSSVYDWLTDVLGTLVAVFLYYRATRVREGKVER